MIRLVNARFVPVWINIRKSPVPDLRPVDEAIGGVKLDAERRVAAGFSQGFFVRSLVIDSELRFLLNPQPSDDPMRTFNVKGHFPYAQVKAQDYLPMLQVALERSRGPRGSE